MKLSGKTAVLLISTGLTFSLVQWMRGTDDGLSPEGAMIRRPAPASWLQFEALRRALEKARLERELAKKAAAAAPSVAKTGKDDSSEEDLKSMAENSSGLVEDSDESERRLDLAASRLSPYMIQTLSRWIKSPRASNEAKVAAVLALGRSSAHASNAALETALHHLPAPKKPVPGGPTVPGSGHTDSSPVVARTILDTVVRNGGSPAETTKFLERAESNPNLGPVHGYIRQLKNVVATNTVKSHYEQQDQALRRIAGSSGNP